MDMKNKGFTIVELLVVIVVIGILASITIVSYTGITQKAIAATLQSDLSNAAKQIKVFQALSSNNDFPTANNCPNPSATEICLKSSGSNSFASGYYVNNASNPKTFTIDATNGTTKYRITESKAPALFTSLATTDPVNWMIIGTQTWAKANLNVGAMILGANPQINNGGGNVIEKYCFNNNELNCTTHGGLYQWSEAMQYATAEGSQGICPTGSHIPTDNEWKILEFQLGMTQPQADTINAWRGTDQGTQIKPSGASGLNLPLAGYRDLDTNFYTMTTSAYIWSSSDATGVSYARALSSGGATIFRNTYSRNYGFSVRCIGN